MARRNENPLGIRKIDYQHERREMERVTSKEHAHRLATTIWADMLGDGKTVPDEVIRFAAVMYANGWEAGVRVGVDKTKERLAEALDRGTLVKP